MPSGKCGGKKLPERWWQEKDWLLNEYAAHETLEGIQDAHGVTVKTLRKWWRHHHLPDFPRGPKAVRRALVGDVSREEILEAELREMRVELAKSRKAEVAEERVLGVLREALEPKQPTYTPPAPRTRLLDVHTPHEFLLAWSDLHGAERVFPDQVNGLNDYGWDEMIERHWRLRRAILSFRKNRPYPIDRLTIAPLGDMVSGDIHDELRETNEKVLTEAAVRLGEFGADWIASLAEDFEQVVVDGCVTGNHGRRHRKPQAKNRFDNFDYIVFEVLRIRLEAHPNISVRVPRSAHAFVEVCGRKILCFHGDGIRTTMTGVPWGGVIRRCNEFEKQYEASGKIDHFLLGHWHEPQITRNRRIIINGSIKGPDEFSVSLGMSSPATQLLLTFHQNRGLTDVSFLDLQEQKDSAPA